MPEYNKRFNDNINLETELFVKKIIFYNDLESRGYISRLNELETNLKKGDVLQKLFNFVFTHNGELPSAKTGNIEEITLVKEFEQIEPYLNETEINLIKNTKKRHLLRVKEIITEYIGFIKKYKRYPLKDSKNLEEKALFESYLRCGENFTQEEKQLIKEVFENISKKEMLKNSYLEMLKNRKLELRIYTKQSIHAKVYIMRNYEEASDYGKVITAFWCFGLRNNYSRIYIQPCKGIC